MAKQHGLIPVTGTMGDITFVKTKDGFQSRQKSSTPGSRIKTDPEFQRTRENLAEFGRARKARKLLRKALRTLILRAAALQYPSKTLLSKTDVIRWFDEYESATLESKTIDLCNIEWHSCYSSLSPRAVTTARQIFNGEIALRNELRELNILHLLPPRSNGHS